MAWKHNKKQHVLYFMGPEEEHAGLSVRKYEILFKYTSLNCLNNQRSTFTVLYNHPCFHFTVKLYLFKAQTEKGCHSKKPSAALLIWTEASFSSSTQSLFECKKIPALSNKSEL